MPLTEKGEEIKHNMEKEYGKEHGERVFYASKNAGTISGVDSVPVAGCYGLADEEPEKNPRPPTSGVPQGRIYNSWGEYFVPAPGHERPGPGEKNHDQSWPPMDPTSIGAMPAQPSGPQEPSDADPERLQFKSHEARNPVEERRRERERGEEAARRARPTGPEVPHKDAAPTKHDPSNGQFTGGGGYAGQEEREKHTSGGGQLKSHAGNAAVREAVRGYSNNQSSQKATKEALRKAGVSESDISKIDWNKSYFPQRVFGDAAPQPGEPSHEARELAMAHELEAMHNPSSTFEDALFGGGRGHDYSHDTTGLPQTVTHRQMQNFAAALNFGEGVTK